MRELEKRLSEACGTGEIIEIVYFGGTQPGTMREVMPISIVEPYLTAVCLASGERKTYRLDRLRLAARDESVARYVVGAGGPLFASVAQFAAQVRPLLDPGWHVEETATGFSVHARFKNGKPRKRALASLRLSGEGYQRPWLVDGATRRTFYSLDKASKAFVDELGLSAAWVYPTPPKPAPNQRREPRSEFVVSIVADFPHSGMARERRPGLIRRLGRALGRVFGR